MNTVKDLPRVSIVIASFNYGRYVAKAIQSALLQTHGNIELIVVDDGSTDDTREIVSRYENVIYHYQENAGLSAARNVGINISSGDYLLFLDADDWLEPTGVAENLEALRSFPQMAFVSGNYYLFRQTTQELFPATNTLVGDAYLTLLRRNYVGMLATVLFRREVFNEFRFDESLDACEDYDLYLRITRNCPAMHNDKFIATYFFHPGSLSHDHKAMSRSVREVMRRQEPLLRSEAERLAYQDGKDQWKEYDGLYSTTSATASTAQ